MRFSTNSSLAEFARVIQFLSPTLRLISGAAESDRAPERSVRAVSAQGHCSEATSQQKMPVTERQKKTTRI